VLAFLKCWIWAEPDVHERLLLGWICAGLLCGALHWRPHVWIHAPRGSGKSTLNDFLGMLLAKGESCVLSADASAAGVRSVLNHDSLPVLFEESEPSEENTKLNALITLARLASSGGLVLRGTADHGSAAFTVRFMGLFSSVMRPPLTSQDLSRIAFLTLRKTAGGRAPVLQPEALRLLGQRLFRRMLDAWPRMQEALVLWRDALMAAGLDARGADQFGTLLAAADVALHDDLPDTDSREEIATRVFETTRADRAEDRPEWARCIGHMTTSIAPQWRGGEQRTVGQSIAIAARRAVIPDPDTGELGRPGAVVAEDAQKALATLGLKVIPLVAEGDPRPVRGWRLPPDGTPPRDPAPDGNGDMLGHLAVANSHAALNGLFRNSRWASRAGTAGGWKAALEEAPGARMGETMRFGGPTSRCVLVPLDTVLDDAGEGMPG